MFTEGEKRGWRWKAEDRRGHSGLVSWKLDGIFRSWFSWSLDWSFPHFIHPFNLEISEPLLFSLVVYFRFIDSICRLLRINQTISTESRSVFFSNTKIHWGTRDDGSDDDNSDDYDCDLITHMTTRQNLSRTWTNWKILSSEKEKCAVRKMESLFRYFTYKFSIFVSAKCKVATWSIILIFLKWDPDFC